MALQRTLKNRSVFCADNLEVLRGIDSETIDLIYLDPPFNKKKHFTARNGSAAQGASFQDRFNHASVKEEWLGQLAEQNPALNALIMAAGYAGHSSDKWYLCYMAIRLLELHRILARSGSLYLHCDPTMSHWLKLVLDAIFGPANFRNEIVWSYGGRGMSKAHFNRKHDLVFFYSRNRKYVFNHQAVRRPIRAEHTARYNKIDKEGRRYARVKNKDGSYSDIYLKETGVVFEDTWYFPFVRGKEYIGYPTQKPLALLERIINASSGEGDVVLDPFCGCATTCIAAEIEGRQWIGIDVSEKAYDLVQARLKQATEQGTLRPAGRQGEVKTPQVHFRTDLPVRTDLTTHRITREPRQILYGRQFGFCGVCYRHFEIRDLEIDHIIPRARGGGDHLENLQLLCSHCNRTKGQRLTNEETRVQLRSLGFRVAPASAFAAS